MELYTELEDRYRGYQGGFIWDYIDQAVYKEEQGKERLVYGGDFDDRATDYCFCTDGIVYADRRPSPKVQEVKQLFSDIRIQIDEGKICIENRKLFKNLDDFFFRLKVNRQEVCIKEEIFTVCAEPGETAVIPLGEMPCGDDEETVITVTAHLKENTIFAPAGYETAFDQAAAGQWHAEKAVGDTRKFNVVYGDVNIGARGKDFFAMFSKGKGGLISLVYRGKEYITRVPRFIFSRAYTDNDRGMGAPLSDSGWIAATAGISYVQDSFRAEETKGCLKVSMEYEAKYPEVFRCTKEYEIDAAGTLKIRLRYPGIQKEKYLPLFGLEMKLKKENDRFSYYGLGPDENYADRKCGARLGVYNCTPQKNMAEYLIPQECGNRENVRYVEIKDASGKGIRIEALGRPFSCSVLPYSAAELENAMHREELPQQNYTWVRIMACQSGVGGDDSWGPLFIRSIS